MRLNLVPATFAAMLFVMLIRPAVAAADRPVFIWGPECHFAESLEAPREECEATAPGYRHAFLVPCTAARSLNVCVGVPTE